MRYTGHVQRKYIYMEYELVKCILHTAHILFNFHSQLASATFPPFHMDMQGSRYATSTQQRMLLGQVAKEVCVCRCCMFKVVLVQIRPIRRLIQVGRSDVRAREESSRAALD